MATPEEIANTLTSDPEWDSLSEQEQDQAFQLALQSSAQSSIRSNPVQPKTFSQLNPIQKAFYPANFIREGVGNRVTQDLTTIQQLLGATGIGQVAQATAPPLLRMLAARAPQDIGQTAGLAASLPVDPSTYLFGGVGAIPSKTARTLLGATVGSVAAAGQPHADAGSIALGATLGGLGSRYTRLTNQGVQIEPPNSTLAGDVYRVTQTPLRARFVNSVREAFLQSKKLAGETFGNKIDTLSQKFPDKTVDLTEEVFGVQQRSLNNPAFKALVMRGVRNDQESTLMQSILNQPETAANLTLKDAQSLKQVFSRVLKQKFNQISPEYADAHLDALDIWHGIRAKQLEAFPEFSDIAANYRKALNNFRQVKPYLSATALEPNLLNNFGNRAEIMQSVRELLPKETLKEIERYVRAYHVVSGAKKAAIGAVATIGAGLGIKSILGERR